MSYLNDKNKLVYIESIYNQVAIKLSAECDRIGDKIPYIAKDGLYEDTDIFWWTNGFFPGMMWQMYHATREVKYKEKAEQVEKKLDAILYHYDRLDHDVGFIYLHTAVANYRLTGKEEAKQKALLAASVLTSRFHTEGGFIRAWNSQVPCGMIIDCLMNLPLLHWASGIVKDNRFSAIANQHVDAVVKHIIREDGSCNHIVELDESTGEFINNPGGQGFGQGSSWSRGQSWGVYGMALAYRYSKSEEYLQKAKKIAHYFIANVALTNYVSIIDFRAPLKPVYFDTTATACAACGLLELSNYVEEYEKELYIQSAYRMFEALSKNFVDLDKNRDGILLKGSAKYHREIDREVAIIYGDYFYLELCLRFLEKDFMIW